MSEETQDIIEAMKTKSETHYRLLMAIAVVPTDAAVAAVNAVAAIYGLDRAMVVFTACMRQSTASMQDVSSLLEPFAKPEKRKPKTGPKFYDWKRPRNH